ncbi:MAG: hypothetical protein IKL52_07310 [Candidatus Gastranaerophilales bacterium]|nr:hypothetical protein [Candidatus Gastranaerophilales bacterium]
MKIPPILSLGTFMLQKNRNPVSGKLTPLPPLQNDTISFSATISRYLKKYNTLPDEIKNVLSPKDAIDMFRDMEFIQRGVQKGRKIGQGNYSQVYENPWLEDYYILISQNPEKTTQIIYSRHELGNAIWSDKDNGLIQIIKKAG